MENSRNKYRTSSDNGTCDFQVTRIDYQQRNLENIIELRHSDGQITSIPEYRFRAMCDWYYNYHVDTLKTRPQISLKKIEEIRGEILGAMARGYCTKINENKIVDPDLIEDMCKEVIDIIKEAIDGIENDEDLIKLFRSWCEKQGYIPIEQALYECEIDLSKMRDLVLASKLGNHYKQAMILMIIKNIVPNQRKLIKLRDKK
jgi:hypothetical protein